MEVILRLKHTLTGWRHYITLPAGTQLDISQGDRLTVQFDGGPLSGRYEAFFTGCKTAKEVKAWLAVEIMPGMVAEIPLPLGSRIKEVITDG